MVVNLLLFLPNWNEVKRTLISGQFVFYRIRVLIVDGF